MITRNESLFSLFTSHEVNKDILEIRKFKCNNCNSPVNVTEEYTNKGTKMTITCLQCGASETVEGNSKINFK